MTMPSMGKSRVVSGLPSFRVIWRGASGHGLWESRVRLAHAIMAGGRTSAVETAWEITLNGQRREVPEPLTVAQLLSHLELKPEYVAVEVNRDLVSRSRHAEASV